MATTSVPARRLMVDRRNAFEVVRGVEREPKARANPVKRSLDGARIDVLARREDNGAVISVRDTGIDFTFGIPIQP